MKKDKNKMRLSLLLLAASVLLTGCADKGEEVVFKQLPEQSAEGSALEERTEIVPDAPASIWVHICGAVREPGVYELPAESRVCAALAAAGGFTEEAAADSVNLAGVLCDGQQIIIRTEEEKEAGDLAAIEEEQGIVNINTASADKLCTLPGIGASRAESIIAFREKAGGFKTPEEIMKVEGIKEGMYARLKDKITIGN